VTEEFAALRGNFRLRAKRFAETRRRRSLED
jgi:hypothetical protein